MCNMKQSWENVDCLCCQTLADMHRKNAKYPPVNPTSTKRDSLFCLRARACLLFSYYKVCPPTGLRHTLLPQTKKWEYLEGLMEGIRTPVCLIITTSKSDQYYLLCNPEFAHEYIQLCCGKKGERGKRKQCLFIEGTFSLVASFCIHVILEQAA